jgi:hypothetical protein
MIEVDIWVRGTTHATTRIIEGVPADARGWTHEDVGRLLTEMLLALERQKNPDSEPPAVTLRGFSWIVSAYDAGGVVLHLEMEMGSASAGPFMIDERALTAMVERVLSQDGTVH